MPSLRIPILSPLTIRVRPFSLLSFSRRTCKRMFSSLDSRNQTITPLSSTIELCGKPVQIVAGNGLSESDFRNAIDSFLFKKWLRDLQSESGILALGHFTLKHVLIQGVDMFGRRVGFLKFKAEIGDDYSGKKVPGIVFARGEAVAILVLLELEGTTFVVLTEQDVELKRVQQHGLCHYPAMRPAYYGVTGSTRALEIVGVFYNLL
ncbi:nudix hydrolase 14, chloroplastic-like [Amborella trichopoda]|uniref:nudix hydrolase 14, chloroplastic-like n=1 Tax=Amborella trichopoda TaxID=13333 RepID=UPI0005D33D6A|nr:nudix hydrolase 14, chloroplastic-like [Amborella trichopoda]|eukprot:XP_011628421.1 nudix hydrolase 14, chloroplastic-like [Amborella trichopoda]